MTDEKPRSKWLSVDLPHAVLILPESDIRPHGSRMENGEYEIDGLQCECGPTVKTGGRGITYSKPMIVHHSFRERAAIDKALKENFT